MQQQFGPDREDSYRLLEAQQAELKRKVRLTLLNKESNSIRSRGCTLINKTLVEFEFNEPQVHLCFFNVYSPTFPNLSDDLDIR